LLISKLVRSLYAWTVNVIDLDFPAQNDVINRALVAPSPSSAAALNGFIHEQEKHPIWNGRPSKNRGIPIQLYHPSFANFLRVAHEDTGEIELKPEDYSATHSLFYRSAAVYKEENNRIEETNVFLDRVIGRATPSLELSCMKIDGACRVLCGDYYVLAAQKEVKNEHGTGGCDASHQCCMGFRLYYAREEVCHPGPILVLISQGS